MDTLISPLSCKKEKLQDWHRMLEGSLNTVEIYLIFFKRAPVDQIDLPPGGRITYSSPLSVREHNS